MNYFTPKPIELDRMIEELQLVRDTVGEGTINPGYLWDEKFDYDTLPWVMRARNYAISAAVTKMLRELCAGAERDTQNHIGVNFPRGAFQTDHKTNDLYGVGGTINGWTVRVRSFGRNSFAGTTYPSHATISLKNKKVMNFDRRYMYMRVGEEWATDGGVINCTQFTDLPTIFKELETLHTLLKLYKH